EQEPLGVVAVALAGGGIVVYAGAIEELALAGVADLQHPQTTRARGGSLEQLEARRLLPHAPRDVDPRKLASHPIAGSLQSAVGRHHHRDAMAAARLLQRQRA